MAIKDPTSALFRRQGGNHLLIVGQNDEAALGVTAAAIVEPGRPVSARRVRRRSASGARFFVLDGTPEDHPEHAAALGRVAASLAARDQGRRLARAPRVPGRGGRRAGPRQQPDAGDGPELFLFIHDLPRFRDLRRREDDFGFGRKEDEPSPPTIST